jgi:hypothetical protein
MVAAGIDGLPAHCMALGIVQSVEASEAQQEPESRPDTDAAQSSHITLDKAGFDSGLPNPLSGRAQGASARHIASRLPPHPEA